MDLNQAYKKIEDLLEDEEHATESIAARQERREHIQKEIRLLTSHITKLNNRFRALPELPPAHLVEWAKAVLEMPNLAFVVLDTTSVDDDADIIRIFVADSLGQVILDQLVMPGRKLTANTTYTGIDSEKLLLAYHLAEVWPRVQEALAGRYVLSYNLSFVQIHLTENATHYHLPGITLIGECLQNQARDYWHTYYPPKLVGLCERIGHQLAQPATAPDRVQGQLAVLRAMSQGIMDVATEPEEVGDPLAELEVDPF